MPANKRISQIRAVAETAKAELVVITNNTTLTRLRIEQARSRTGLDDLLCPALDELDQIDAAVKVIGDQMNTALTSLLVP